MPKRASSHAEEELLEENAAGSEQFPGWSGGTTRADYRGGWVGWPAEIEPTEALLLLLFSLSLQNGRLSLSREHAKHRKGRNQTQETHTSVRSGVVIIAVVVSIEGIRGYSQGTQGSQLAKAQPSGSQLFSLAFAQELSLSICFSVSLYPVRTFIFAVIARHPSDRGFFSALACLSAVRSLVRSFGRQI